MPPRSPLALAFAVGALGGCFLSPNVPPSFRYSCESDDDCAVLTCLGDAVPVDELDSRGLVEADCESVEAIAEPSKYYQRRQRCSDGLCQFPCALASYQSDCPSGKGYNFCFNGNCAHLCGTNPDRFPDPDSTCPDPQVCVIFGEDIDIDALAGFLPSGGGSGGSSNPFGGSSAPDLTELEGSGVCGVRCDAKGAPPCPAGEYCGGALCLPGCDEPNATPCAEGSQCVAFGDFSACLATCDPAAESPCPEDQVCLFGVCAPTCAGDSECLDGFVCDPELKTCVPAGDLTTSGTGSSG